MLPSLLLAAVGPPRPRRPPPTLAARLLPHRDAGGGALRPRRRRARGPVARQPRPPDRRHQPRQVPVRGRRPGRRTACSTRAASPASTASGRRPARRSASPDLPRVAALPGAAGPGPARPAEARRRRARSARSGRRRSTPRPASSTAPRCRGRRPGPCWRTGRPATKVDLLAARRRLHRGRDGEVPRRREAPGRRCSSRRALPGAPGRLQRVGGRHAGGRERDLAAPDGVFRRSPWAPPTTPSTPSATCSPSTTRLRDVAAAAPYDFVVILVNDRKYGGGGIFNLYATVACRHRASPPYVFVHEFGHHFAGLADEYYTSDVAYETATPSAPSRGSRTSPPCSTRRRSSGATSSRPGRRCRRRGPRRPSRRREGDPGSAGGGSARRTRPRRRWRRSSARSRERGRRCWAPSPRRRRSAPSRAPMYEAKGLYRPAGRLHHVHARRRRFCRVCRRAIERVIDLYARASP